MDYLRAIEGALADAPVGARLRPEFTRADGGYCLAQCLHRQPLACDVALFGHVLARRSKWLELVYGVCQVAFFRFISMEWEKAYAWQ